MALRFYTGFDYYDETQAARIFPYFSNGTSIAPGRFQGRAWQWANQPGYFAIPIPNASTVIIGMAFHLSSGTHTGADPTNPFLVFQDATTSMTNPITQVDVRMTTDLGFQITRNGALIGTSLPNLFQMNFWNYMEIKVFISDTAGTIQIKINGQIYVNLSGLDTKYTGNNYVNMIRLQSFAATGYTLKVDDMYICDDTGANNNGFRGECRVQTQYATANGDVNQFQAIGAATNWQAVSELVADDDLTYVRSGITGDIDDYQMGTIDLTGTIYGVQVNVTHRKDDVGVRIITPIIKSNGHTFEGNMFTCLSDYSISSKIWEQEPQNVADWTNASVNALKVGVKIKG